ncbi:ATP-binding protein [Neobacillus jeddahensis]|uniref:ATP-binding protein n=1 Tax=Neobacillus jeddahensis TaxID=1461580 RepID=UPI00058E8CB1|nr:ATP-binding protein [Neobacillus jeddahensis]
MLAEKLLLNVLITLAPVILYSILIDGKHKAKPRFLGGISLSIAALACMIFSYSNYGFNWDLRYVPLILAFLYGGLVEGGLVLTTLLIARFFFGGDTAVFGVINTLLTAVVSLFIKKSFFNKTPNQRVVIATLLGACSLLICYFSFTAFYYFEGNIFKLVFHIPDLLLVGLIDTLAIALGAKLIEGIIVRDKMRLEIQRSEKLNTLGELAASIAHEIRNPLTVVKGFLQIMQQEECSKNHQYLSLVLSELGRAESIINDYLNFAKPKFEKIDKIDLNEILTDVVLLLDPLAVRQGVLLDKKLDSSRVSLVTDRNQFKQALINLIKNAIEATPESGKVTIHSKYTDHKARILIIDTGKGMTNEQLSRIGTLFYTTKDKGTGLGTSVSLRIIETMNGTVTYHSEPGLGTEVTLVLPAEQKAEFVLV